MVVMLVVGMAAPAWAQTPESAASAPSALPSMAAVPAAIPVGSRVGLLPSTYDDGGRRDPFASLIAPRRTAAGAVAAPDGRPRRGLSALSLADVAVRGVVRSGSVMMAILEGPNKQSFVARASDQLLDASIASIDAGGVVFNELSELGGSPNQVRKALRAAGEELR
jgi:Tfp pilus assembly protein PilP